MAQSIHKHLSNRGIQPRLPVLLTTCAFMLTSLAACGGGGGGGGTGPTISPPPPPPPPPARTAERVAYVGPDMINPNGNEYSVNLANDDQQAQEKVVLANFPSGSVNRALCLEADNWLASISDHGRKTLEAMREDCFKISISSGVSQPFVLLSFFFLAFGLAFG